MFKVMSAEFLKLRRSKTIMLAVIASIIPAIVKCLQYAFNKSENADAWKQFLGSGQEFMVLAMLTIVILVSSFIFSMEYQYKTSSYIFTSSTSKTNIFTAKLISTFAIIALLFIVSACSQLLFGYLVLKKGLSTTLLFKLAKVTLWYIVSYFLISTVVSMLSVLTKRFTVCTVAILGYIILVFPFHLKNNLYVCPFMNPIVVAAKIYGSNNYIFTNYYKDVSVSNINTILFISILAIVSLIIGIIAYKKQDAIN
jgi:ABC-type transport system involved in multi-copper enzyme maturation permease subunit